VRTGDIITAIDDRRVRRVEDVTSAIGLRRPGETIRISLVRNGSSQTVTISLAGKNKVE
jgi:S1-C subfamily serine protease